MRSKILLKLGFLFFILLVLSSGQSFANGQHDHGNDNAMSDHMKAMYALKDKVSEEYRIMERTPIIPDEESLKSGAKLYQQQCAVCHGQNGLGDGPAAKSSPTKPANFMDTEHSAIYGPGEKYWIIGNGSGVTGMPAFSHIDPLNRWNLVNYIYSLQKAGQHSGHNHKH